MDRNETVKLLVNELEGLHKQKEAAQAALNRIEGDIQMARHLISKCDDQTPIATSNGECEEGVAGQLTDR